MTGPVPTGPPLTPEQAEAVARRDGSLLVGANAGSGKTTVLVERFVAGVLHDGITPDQILAITYTDKAAGELRARVRARLLELGERRLAQDTESAWISTIHGLCARILHTHAVAAGLDPDFVTIDEAERRALRATAFDEALAGLLDDARADALDLVAAYGPDPLREMIFAAFDQLRSAGQTHPRLPCPAPPNDLVTLAVELAAAALAAQDEIPPAAANKSVANARGALAHCAEIMAHDEHPPERALARARFTAGNATALAGPACARYLAAHEAYAQANRDVRACAALTLLNELMTRFDAAFAAAKRAAAALDFDDLQLCARDLLRDAPAIADAYAQRFSRIMIDEFQDTSPLQLDLLDRLDRDDTFVVGDALQSIYGFRHASVALFMARRATLAQHDAVATLAANFRSRPALIGALNRAFGPLFGADATPLVAGRSADSQTTDAPVELLITDTAGWDDDGAPDLGVLPAPATWRRAEARLVAQRVADLIDSGAFAAKDIAVLIRAATDLATYERALQDRGVPTLASGGRGFWARQQVLDLTSYLAALINPRDEAALLGVLASPLVGLGSDSLALLARAAREAGTGVWDQIAAPPPLTPADTGALAAFATAFAAERDTAPRLGLDELLERVVARTRYDEHVLTLPGGRRRLANVHKLIRLAAAYEERHGRDVRGLVQRATEELDADAREPDAPVDLAGLDAVRLMTIHAAKGLEFAVVVVADLGRQPPVASPKLALGADGRVGLLLYDLDGTHEPALDHAELVGELREADAAELRRVLYVACTRAQELLILSGGVNAAKWPAVSLSAPPISWLGPAFVADVAQRLADGEARQRVGDAELVRNAADTVGTVLRDESLAPRGPAVAADAVARLAQTRLEGLPGDAPAPPPPVATLSYSSLSSYAQCPYRFYLERIRRLPPDEPPPALAAAAAPATDAVQIEAMLRGTLAHELLEELDLRAPVLPSRQRLDEVAARHETELDDALAQDLLRLVQAAIDTETMTRVAAARDIRREHRFSFLLGDDGPLVNGVVDVLAREPSGAAVIVDYKTDAVTDADLEAAVQRSYGVQRRIYALAALRGGAPSVEVCHLYLERPGDPVIARYVTADAARLERELREHAAGLLGGDFAPSPNPYLGLCATCPGRAALCEHPPELTERLAPV